ncbi:MAG: FIST C-terminal domain-containing protein [Alphaproteobacteria bacterium]|nr:FIST C-terminal domain-containing protein [Alphaproteobacteria bacterium]
MSAILQTSSLFASATARGTDWRDIGRKILETIEGIRTPDDGMNTGFLYTTYALGEDAASLLALLKNVTRIQNWYGAAGPGICGGGRSFVDTPAACVMIGRLPAGSSCGFSMQDDDMQLPDTLRNWLTGHMAGAALVHGIGGPTAASRLAALRDREGLYTIGGFSGLESGMHIHDGQLEKTAGLSGVVLDGDIRLMTATSYGCLPAGKPGRITECHDHIIHSIDDQPAFMFLRDAIASIDLPETQQDERHLQIHAAFPVPASDNSALLVRSIAHADEAMQTITVQHHMARGDTIQFVYRDRMAALSDLSQTLKNLHIRARRDSGSPSNLQPKGILYFGCGARMPMGEGDDEAGIIKDVMGDIPMAGFYTAAEICNGHVFGYTGVILVFL